MPRVCWFFFCGWITCCHRILCDIFLPYLPHFVLWQRSTPRSACLPHHAAVFYRLAARCEAAPLLRFTPLPTQACHHRFLQFPCSACTTAFCLRFFSSLLPSYLYRLIDFWFCSPAFLLPLPFCFAGTDCWQRKRSTVATYQLVTDITTATFLAAIASYIGDNLVDLPGRKALPPGPTYILRWPLVLITRTRFTMPVPFLPTSGWSAEAKAAAAGSRTTATLLSTASPVRLPTFLLPFVTPAAFILLFRSHLRFEENADGMRQPRTRIPASRAFTTLPFYYLALFSVPTTYHTQILSPLPARPAMTGFIILLNWLYYLCDRLTTVGRLAGSVAAVGRRKESGCFRFVHHHRSLHLHAFAACGCLPRCITAPPTIL